MKTFLAAERYLSPDKSQTMTLSFDGFNYLATVNRGDYESVLPLSREDAILMSERLLNGGWIYDERRTLQSSGERPQSD